MNEKQWYEMDSTDMLEALAEVMGESDLLYEIIKYLGEYEAANVLTDIANTWGIICEDDEG